MKWLEDLVERSTRRALLFSEKMTFERLTTNTQRNLFHTNYKIKAQRNEIENLHNQIIREAERHNKTKAKMADYFRALKLIESQSECAISSSIANEVIVKHEKKKK